MFTMPSISCKVETVYSCAGKLLDARVRAVFLKDGVIPGHARAADQQQMRDRTRLLNLRLRLHTLLRLAGRRRVFNTLINFNYSF